MTTLTFKDSIWVIIVANPFQGLKLLGARPRQWTIIVIIVANPFQGLKPGVSRSASSKKNESL